VIDLVSRGRGFYSVDFSVDDSGEVQRKLNDLYRYRDDVATKVLHRTRLNLFYTLVGDLIDRGVVNRFETAVDVGCNAGAYCRMLGDFGFRSVSGFDIESEYVERARTAFAGPGIDFSVGRAEELGGAYDFILCTEVIEHTDEPLQVVASIKRALNPGGVAVLSVPNRISLPYLGKWAVYKLRRWQVSEDMAAHLSFPFYRTLRLFNDDGVRVIATDGANLIFNNPVLKLLYPTPLFGPLNRLNFRLARRWPLKYFSQFFYVVLQRT
jgi:2-polyprenyl-3-methyl-5-hydroxy-6-metoxy-1,4-benzoquinol methylase